MSFRRRPLDFSSGGSPAREEEASAVDVVVPVHGAEDAFRACLASLARHTDFRRHRLTVVLDGPGQAGAEEAIAALSRSGALLSLVRHATTLGYVATVNEAIRATSGDVVLLNSDTVVTARWLEKMARAAASASEIATVTPFSNDAALCSLPRPFEANELPAGFDVDSFARLVEERSERRYPRLPTGVGFCLYVKRRALDALGTFDEAFSPGYGEENDFCFRALKAGWRHALDDATFVFHAGHRSFGPSTGRLRRRARRILLSRHPEYEATIAKFMAGDPLAAARARVTGALAPAAHLRPARPRVVHLVHGWPPWAPAGTEQYARGLALRQAADRPTAAFARIADPEARDGGARELVDGGVRVRLIVNGFRQRDPLARNAIRNRPMETSFGAFLDEVRPDIVHVHHLSGHAIGLVREIRRRRIRWIFQLQDWWAACARANLWRPDGSLCDGPGAFRCARCLPLTAVAPSRLWNPVLHAVRRREGRRAVAAADAVVAGSRFAVESFRALGGIGVRSLTRVVPYGVSVAEAPPAPARRPGPLRFGVVGSVLPHKGIHVAVDAFRAIPPERALLEVWGPDTASPGYVRELRQRATSAVSFHGAFPEEAKGGLLSGLDVLIVPSVGLESFGLAAREALRRGVPVIASRRGALPELFSEGVEPAGALFEPENAGELRGWVERLADDPSILSRWKSAIGRVKGMDEHAREIEAIYDEVLAR